MNIHSKSYPTQTTLATPGQVRPPTTLFEHFRADTLGCKTYPEFCEMVGNVDPKTMMAKIVALLDAPGVLQVFNNVPDKDFGRIMLASHGVTKPISVGRLIELGATEYRNCPRLVCVLDGKHTVVKEWLPETKDSATVEKT